MPNVFETPSVVASVALETLYRQLVLPRLVYTDIINDFAPGTGGTVTIPKPAVLTARTFNRASGDAITLDEIDENGVPVTLDLNIYSAVPIPDEDAALNIRNFASQILLPQTQAVAQHVEDRVAQLFASLPSTPSPAGANEVQTITLSGTPTGGSFTVTFDGDTTDTIAFNAAASGTAASVQGRLAALDSVGVGNVTVTGSAGGPWTVTFGAELADTDVPVMTTTDSLTGGSTPHSTVATTTAGAAKGPGNADIAVDMTADSGVNSPIKGLTAAWKALTLQNVPAGGRVFVGGAGYIGALLDDPNLSRADEAGNTDALVDAQVNRVRGFQVYESNAFPSDVGYAFVAEAIAFVTKAPTNPRGATASAAVTDNGMTMRWLSDYDAAHLQDRSIVSVLAGGGIVDANRAVRLNLTEA